MATAHSESTQALQKKRNQAANLNLNVPKILTVHEVAPGYKPSCHADEYTTNWFLTHARIPQASLRPGRVPMVYFPTTETALIAPTSDVKEIPFAHDIGPLRYRGTVQGTQLKSELGLVPVPSIFYKLADINIDFGEGGPGSETKEFDDVFYKGQITVYCPNAGKSSQRADGIFDIFATVDWLGLGLDIAGAVIPIIASI